MDLLKSAMEAFRIPQDTSSRFSYLQVCGNHQIKLENYTRIIEYHSDRLLLQCKTCQLEISGSRLQIVQYSGQELILEGAIQKIVFL